MRRNQISSSTRNGPVHLNMTTHAQKPDFVFRARRTSPFKSARWGVVSSVECWPAEVCGISVSNAGYTVFRGSVKSTDYPLHSPVSVPLPPPPCVTVCRHISTGVYQQPQGECSPPSRTEDCVELNPNSLTHHHCFFHYTQKKKLFPVTFSQARNLFEYSFFVSFFRSSFLSFSFFLSFLFLHLLPTH